MPTITLSATPKGNGYQATVTFPDGLSNRLGSAAQFFMMRLASPGGRARFQALWHVEQL
jgi:hypothetical protein